MSKALARNWAAPGGVRSTTRLALASALTSSSAHSRASRSRRRHRSRGAPTGDAVAALGRHGVDQRAVGAADLDRVELDEVAAEGGLGDADAVLGEQVGELGLGADGVGGHEVDDPLVAGALGQRAHGAS